MAASCQDIEACYTRSAVIVSVAYTQDGILMDFLGTGLLTRTNLST
jgi:hypothetical protein